MPENQHPFADPSDRKTWLASDLFQPASLSSLQHIATSSTTTAGNGSSGSDVDKVLFRNLVEMVPLVESLMDRRANSSFTRRASVVYTSSTRLKKADDLKTKKLYQSNMVKKQKDGRQHTGDELSNISSKSFVHNRVQNDKDELHILREQIEQLHKCLIEKEETLKFAEDLGNRMNTVNASLYELKVQVSEKDELIKSTNSQLYSTKITLADKQAALEKLEWEVKMSNRKVVELQGNVASNELEISAMMQLFEELERNDSSACHDEQSAFYEFEPCLLHLDDINEIDMVSMEEARGKYLKAVAAAEEDPTDESLAAAAEARRRLQSFVL